MLKNNSSGVYALKDCISDSPFVPDTNVCFPGWSWVLKYYF